MLMCYVHDTSISVMYIHCTCMYSLRILVQDDSSTPEHNAHINSVKGIQSSPLKAYVMNCRSCVDMMTDHLFI